MKDSDELIARGIFIISLIIFAALIVIGRYAQ